MIYKLYYDENDVYSNTNSNTTDANSRSKESLDVKIVIVGDYMVGKTSYVRRLCQNQFKESHDKTKSVSQETFVKLRNGKQIKVEIYDTPGLEQFRVDISTILNLCHGAIIMYDVTEPYSFKNIQQHLDQLKRKLPPDGEILLVGCKTDWTKERKITFKEADEFAAKKNLSLFETSSKDNINIENSMDELVQRIVDRRQIGTFDPATMVIADSTEKPRPPALCSLFCCWVF